MLGLSGPGSLGRPTDHQDFLTINHDWFPPRTSDEFVDVVVAASKGPLSLIVFLIRTQGVRGALAGLKVQAKMLGKPFAGFAGETFNTALPIAIGPHAAKLRLKSVSPRPAANNDFGEDFRTRIAAAPQVYEVGLQFFTDEATTPIENPPVAWPESESPWVPVARLTVRNEPVDGEDLSFDPWGGLEAHRPLGEINRARKAAYFASQQGRKA